MDTELVKDAAGYLGHWLDYRRRTLQVPGLVGALALDGELLMHVGYGLADVEAGTTMPVDAVFPIASHSKTFTAAVVLRLVEQGRLRLDDTVAQLVPAVSAVIGSVTVGELLSHSGGITRDSAGADFWQLAEAFPDAADLPHRAQSVLGRHARFKYSNIGFGLAGLVIEAACHEPYAVVARRELIDVLGLASTSPEVLGRGCPTGYSARRGGLERRPLPLPDAAGLNAATGFCSTAADLCTFATSLCDGSDVLLDEDSRRAMRHVVWLGENGDADYCLGLNHTMVGDRHVHGHGGAYPGFITSTRFVAADRLVAVVLCNAIDAPSQELTSTMFGIVDHALSCRTGPLPTAGTGRYSGLWGTYDVVRFGGQLLAFDPELPDPVQRRIELEPDAEQGWRVTRSSGYANPGESVTFAGDTCRFGGMTLKRELAW
jgi:CubicO group peptidase (beta-lactamase class C family)